jgi:hypothetical protein
LQGHSLDYTREVLELPEPQPIEVIEHRVIKRFCPHCRRWHSPTLDLQGQVLGQGRIGVRIASLIAYLRTSLRLPIRRIQSYLRTIHHLSLSTGELVELLHQVLLHLSSKHRLSTRFNAYGGLWTDFIMSDLQAALALPENSQTQHASQGPLPSTGVTFV